MAGLGQPLRTDVVLQKPSTLDEAIMLARAYEQRTTPSVLSHPASRATSKPPWSTGTVVPNATAPATASSSGPINQPTVKKFTQTEIANHRIKGLCFKCDKKFVPKHRDSYKRIFCIELLDEEDDDDEPTISLSALTGIQPSTGRTMHVSVAISSTSLRALLNSGSTHNFINTNAAKHAGVSSGGVGLRVAVANGDRISSLGHCLSLLIDIADEQFDIYCYGLALNSFNMVLGVQWLESLAQCCGTSRISRWRSFATIARCSRPRWQPRRLPRHSPQCRRT
jgi:hypothetical protein